jgi:hypothetical protein
VRSKRVLTATLIGESLSAIKGQSAKNPALFAAKVQKLLDMKAARAEPAEEDTAIRDLVHLHFDLVALRWDFRESNPDLYERIAKIQDITRPYVEEPED